MLFMFINLLLSLYQSVDPLAYIRYAALHRRIGVVDEGGAEPGGKVVGHGDGDRKIAIDIIIIAVLFSITSFSPFCMSSSVAVSTFEVASSSITIGLFANMTLLISKKIGRAHV